MSTYSDDMLHLFVGVANSYVLHLQMKQSEKLKSIILYLRGQS